ncbi:hypothetical protein GCM10007989_24560 [Devosia pacifica]|uniref:DUF1236 domain-containing protein n=1 Tax=Devosia pacifica TaxID=1335967 RepID=A0A918VUT7_9HYPH|nr:DUF1236 domain-containing protein [Devosia pacifica]GHA27758.1 hypothetical protein GCM10007989_24560 [Devosia pacifica]
MNKLHIKSLIAASAAVLAFSATPAMSQTAEDGGAVVGGAGGGAAGAGAGFLLGGPLGAVVGGFAGALIGSEAGVAATTIDYAANNPVEPIIVDQAEIGYVLPETVTVHQVEGDPNYGYVYANNRVWIVDNNSRELIQSPGYLVQQTTADYVLANPVDSVAVDAEISAGYTVPQDIELIGVPDQPTYSYVYLNDRPVLVENGSRTVIWVE